MENTKNISDMSLEELYEKVCIGIDEYDVLNNRLYGLQKDIPRRILLILIHHLSEDNTIITSVRDLEKITNFSKKSISNALSFLKKEGWIYVTRCGMSLVITVNTNAEAAYHLKSGENTLYANALFYMEEDMQNESKNPFAYVGENCIYNIRNMDTDEFYNIIL